MSNSHFLIQFYDEGKSLNKSPSNKFKAKSSTN